MKEYIVIFVEGETEKEFFSYLLNFYKTKSSTNLRPYKIINLKGIGNFSSKLSSKLKNDVKVKIDTKGDVVFAVCCAYDTDVFELKAKPPVNWSKVKTDITKLEINRFVQVKAKRMIEDWFLKDIDGLCRFLKIKMRTNLSGKDGFTKIKTIFKSGNRIYLKGTYCHKFMDDLDILKIRNSIKKELEEFEKLLNVTI